MGADFDRVSLASLARGAVIERFDDVLDGVVKNIADVNTGDGPREIVLKVRIKPAPDRMTGAVEVFCHARTQPPRPCATTFYFARGQEGPTALEHVPQQARLAFGKKGEDEGDVITIQGGKA
jgi:hypothetical protein